MQVGFTLSAPTISRANLRPACPGTMTCDRSTSLATVRFSPRTALRQHDIPRRRSRLAQRPYCPGRLKRSIFGSRMFLPPHNRTAAALAQPMKFPPFTKKFCPVM
jgi:hypothetical protein